MFLKKKFPDLFSDIPDREIPKSSETTDFEGRGYIKREPVHILFTDMKEIINIWNNSHIRKAELPSIKVTREGVFFSGQYFDALLRVREILTTAKRNIVIIDGYVNEDVLKSGILFSFDKVWFKNDSIKQAIVIDLYTDFHRLNIFNFSTDDIPTDIINSIELNTSDGNLATYSQKKQEFKDFLDQSLELQTNYFTSNKGFSLGDSKEKILPFYSEPDSIRFENSIEIYIWSFVGDLLYNETQNLNSKPIAKDSYGNTTKLYFKENKLIAVLIHNDIP